MRGRSNRGGAQIEVLRYVNDLPNASNFETRLFADETALLLSDENLIALHNKVNSELLKVET